MGTERQLRILIVEDNPDTALALHALLAAWGHRALIAYDGPRAVRLAREFVPDVVLLDLSLPTMDGYTVAHRIHEVLEQQPMMMVAVTGHGSTADQLRSVDAGFAHHFVKPVDPAALKRAIDDFAEQIFVNSA